MPETLAALLSAFALAFTRPTFAHGQVLITGTLLTSGRRTVSVALRAVGLGGEWSDPDFMDRCPHAAAGAWVGYVGS
jgi:hypothetical protein